MTDLRGLARDRLRYGLDVLRAGGHEVRTVLAPVGRRAPEIVLVVALVLTVLGMLVLIGAARNDAAISANRGVAVGEVLDGSSDRLAFVRFTAADGSVLTPENGVFYPRGLEPGQLVRVEYDVAEPELVRVEGRNWTEGLAPILLGTVVLWSVLGSLAWWLARARTRRLVAAQLAGHRDDAAPDAAPDAPPDADSDPDADPDAAPLVTAAGPAHPTDPGDPRRPVGAGPR